MDRHVHPLWQSIPVHRSYSILGLPLQHPQLEHKCSYYRAKILPNCIYQIMVFIYVTRSGKTVHFALFTEIEVLVSADTPFSPECGNTSFASFGRTVAKLRPRTAGTFADVRFWKRTFENCNENSAYFRIIITTVYLSCDYVIKFLRLRRNGDPRANKRRFASLIEST